MKFDFTSERAAYNVLKKIYCEGAYSSIELDRALDNSPEDARPRITSLVYGTLECSVRSDFVLSVLVKNKMKKSVEILLKMGLYELSCENAPDYAVVDRYVSFAKDRMSGTQGFVNAVLRRSKDVEIPSDDEAQSVSVRYSQPLWLINALISAYGREKMMSILSAKKLKLTHIRRNSSKISESDFSKIIDKISENEDIIPTKYGYYVTHSTLRSLKSDIFTPQSLSSAYAVNIYAEDFIGASSKVLDLCAAPGGKSIYFKELVPKAEVTACDVHEHRVELIRSYAKRMGVKIQTETNDATVFSEKWLNAFDAVICDVPCSGSGLLISSPDILLFKNADDLESLASLQLSILRTASRYVKEGGELLYSTCSLLPKENREVVNNFIESSGNFEISNIKQSVGTSEKGMTTLFPDADGCDGFFIAKLRRTR